MRKLILITAMVLASAAAQAGDSRSLSLSSDVSATTATSKPVASTPAVAEAPQPSDAQFQQFWSPVFQSADPLLIGVGHPIVYMPSRRISQLNAQLFPKGVHLHRRVALSQTVGG